MKIEVGKNYVLFNGVEVTPYLSKVTPCVYTKGNESTSNYPFLMIDLKSGQSQCLVNVNGSCSSGNLDYNVEKEVDDDLEYTIVFRNKKTGIVYDSVEELEEASLDDELSYVVEESSDMHELILNLNNNGLVDKFIDFIQKHR